MDPFILSEGNMLLFKPQRNLIFFQDSLNFIPTEQKIFLATLRSGTTYVDIQTYG